MAAIILLCIESRKKSVRTVSRRVQTLFHKESRSDSFIRKCQEPVRIQSGITKTGIKPDNRRLSGLFQLRKSWKCLYKKASGLFSLES